MKQVLVVSLFVLVGAAGCLSDDDGGDDGGVDVSGIPVVSKQRLPDPGKDFDDVVVTDHGFPGGHTIRALHGGSFGMDLVGYDTLTDMMPLGAVGTGWGAAGLWHNYACVAQWLGTGAIAIVDITDPAAMHVVSQVDDPLVNGDCQFSADGNYMFAGAYLSATGLLPTESAPSCEPVFPRGCPGGGGINVWDTHDKANPQWILFTNTGEYHTLQVHLDEDTNTTYVIQAYAGHIYRFDPDGPSLSEVATIQPMEHDMWLAKHLITGKTYLYTGAGDGFIAYDFDVPEEPKEVAQWQDEGNGESGCCGWHRQATVDQLIDGKVVLVVAGEDCGGGNSLPYYMVDITDITNPTTLSSWEVPGRPRADTNAHLCEFTTHEFSVYDGYIVTANYHAGAWLFDIGSPERLKHPVTLGYYIPANEPLTEDPVFGAQDLTWPWNPFVWGTFFDERGYILLGDFSSGAYMLKIPGVTDVGKA